MNMAKQLVIVSGVIISIILHVNAAEYFLDAAATGADNGDSWENAWTTVSNVAWSKLQPDDTLWIQGGIYNEHLNLVSRLGITIRIATNATQKAVFHGGQIWAAHNSTIDGLHQGSPYFQFTQTSSFGRHGYLVRNTTNLLIRGIEVSRQSEYPTDTQQHHGIHLNGSVDMVVIDSCYIHHTTGDGININVNTPAAREGAYDSFVVTNSVITDVGDDGIQAAANQVTVANCLIDKNDFPTYFGGHPDGFQLNPDRQNVRIYNNTIRGFNQNIFVEWATANILLYNNALIGGQTSGADRGSTISVRTNTWNGVWVMANNVFYNFVTYTANNGGGTLRNLPDVHVVNNVFLNCKLLSLNSPDDFFDQTNFYWDMPGVQYYDTAGNPVAIPSNRNAGNSQYLDPRFASLDTFRLSADSPAIGAGTVLNAYFTHDRFGTTRGPAWDSGLHQLLRPSALRDLR